MTALSVATSGDDFRFGTQSLKVTTGSTGQNAIYPATDVPVNAGESYIMSAYVKTTTPLTGGGLQLQIAGGGTFTPLLASGTITTDSTVGSNEDGWARLLLGITIPAGYTTVRPMVVYTGTVAGQVFWLDAVKFETGTVASEWQNNLVSQGAVLDQMGLVIDGTQSGLFRLKGGAGGSRDQVVLGSHGLLFGGDTELSSTNLGQLYVGTERILNVGDLAGSGHVLTTANEEGIHVEDYGAVGDGVTDDTTAINNAIAATPAGGRLMFQAKNYKITALITINTLITLEGSSGFGGGTVITQATNSIGAFSFGTSADGATLKRIQFVGPGTVGTAYGVAANKTLDMEDVRVNGFFGGLDLGSVGSYYSRIVRCAFEGQTNIGIYLRPGVYNTLIFGCRFNFGGAASSVGVYIDTGAVSNRIISCAIEQYGAQGVRMLGTSSYGNQIAFCYFESQGVGAIAAMYIGYSGQADATLIEGCYVHAETLANYWNVNLANAINSQVQGNYLGGGGAGGGSLSASSVSAGTVLSGNHTPGTVALSTGSALTLAGGALTATGMVQGQTISGTGHTPVAATFGSTTTVVCTTAGTWYKHTGTGNAPFSPAFSGQRWLITGDCTFSGNVAAINAIVALRIDNDTAGTLNVWGRIQQLYLPTSGKNGCASFAYIFTAAAGDVGASRYPYFYFQSSANSTTFTAYGSAGATYVSGFTAVPIP